MSGTGVPARFSNILAPTILCMRRCRMMLHLVRRGPPSYLPGISLPPRFFMLSGDNSSSASSTWQKNVILTGPITGSFFKRAVRRAADLTNDLGRAIQRAQRPGTKVGAAPSLGGTQGRGPMAARVSRPRSVLWGLLAVSATRRLCSAVGEGVAFSRPRYATGHALVSPEDWGGHEGQWKEGIPHRRRRRG